MGDWSAEMTLEEEKKDRVGNNISTVGARIGETLAGIHLNEAEVSSWEFDETHLWKGNLQII